MARRRRKKLDNELYVEQEDLADKLKRKTDRDSLGGAAGGRAC